MPAVCVLKQCVVTTVFCRARDKELEELGAQAAAAEASQLRARELESAVKELRAQLRRSEEEVATLQVRWVAVPLLVPCDLLQRRPTVVAAAIHDARSTHPSDAHPPPIAAPTPPLRSASSRRQLRRWRRRGAKPTRATGSWPRPQTTWRASCLSWR